jgi:hypothetical protein
MNDPTPWITLGTFVAIGIVVAVALYMNRHKR